MPVRIRRVTAILVLASSLAFAANDKKPVLPAYVLRAETVFVLIDPDAGTSPASPQANQKARDDVEKAIMKWGRFRLVMEPGSADLIVVVRKGSGKVVQPTIGGLPTNDRPVIGQPTDNGIRLGGQKGRPPGSTDPSPQDTHPTPQIEAGMTDDMFVVYQGGAGNPLDGPAAWRYMNKDALKSPSVPAVAEFRKAIEEAEKQQQQKKKP
ncbi:MAG TPA: hypothetical protein VFR42_04050 [Candidatus Acidoferrum sp.]|nr:hypothetical protein [Candidatus Acidoferrum sp.]